MTETSPIGTINTPLSKHDALPAQEQQKQRAGQGRPIFGIELQVVDVDGEPLPRDGQSRVSAGQRALGGRAILWSGRERPDRGRLV